MGTYARRQAQRKARNESVTRIAVSTILIWMTWSFAPMIGTLAKVDPQTLIPINLNAAILLTSLVLTSTGAYATLIFSTVRRRIARSRSSCHRQTAPTSQTC